MACVRFSYAHVSASQTMLHSRLFNCLVQSGLKSTLPCAGARCCWRSAQGPFRGAARAQGRVRQAPRCCRQVHCSFAGEPSSCTSISAPRCYVIFFTLLACFFAVVYESTCRVWDYAESWSLQLQDERDGLRAAAAMAQSGGPMTEARQQEREELVASLQVFMLQHCWENGFAGLCNVAALRCLGLRRARAGKCPSRVTCRRRASRYRGATASWREP